MVAAAERDPRRLEEGSGTPELRRRGPHPLVAVAVSAVWPGLGHFGHRNRRALLLATATLAVAVVGLVYSLTRDVRTLLTWSVNRPSLQALIVATLCVLVFRCVVAFDAYRTAARRYPPPRSSILRRLGTLVTLMVLALLTAAPHLIVVRLAADQLTLLSDVFDATDTQTARPTPIPTTAAPPRFPPRHQPRTPPPVCQPLPRLPRPRRRPDRLMRRLRQTSLLPRRYGQRLGTARTGSRSRCSAATPGSDATA